MRLPKVVLRVMTAVIVIAVVIWAIRKDGAEISADSTSRQRAIATAEFDYYLIALSWSPTFCESNPQEREQCSKRGYGFILHGLWPQFERGRGPRNCNSNQSPMPATIERTLAFMPSRRLIEHEWNAHGTCSGLGPEDYFALSDRAFASIRIPANLLPAARPGPMNAEDVRQAFIDANPALKADMLGISCKSGKLSEVRICVDTALQPRQCGKGVGMQCPRDVALHIPLVR